MLIRRSASKVQPMRRCPEAAGRRRHDGLMALGTARDASVGRSFPRERMRVRIRARMRAVSRVPPVPANGYWLPFEELMDHCIYKQMF